MSPSFHVARRAVTVLCMASVVGCHARTPTTPAASSTGSVSPALCHEDLDATLWMQTSAEYAAITEMVYQLAWEKVELALEDPIWSAMGTQQERLIEQKAMDSQDSATTVLPPAVILDVDETVLDNSAYQALLVKEGGEFDPDSWLAFCESAQSVAIPGVKQFLDRCREAGIAVYFLTNREHHYAESTCRNLIDQGLLLPEETEHVLSRGQRPEWDSDKESRRQFVADAYRVLAIVGDDLNDFVWVGFKPTVDDRRRISADHADLWGRVWFMLPNANYGGWERASYAWEEDLPRADKLRRKQDALILPTNTQTMPAADAQLVH